ncbi:non-ribosomal peptide synthetase, partial [Paenibacillus sp. 598K]|uniref:non-ribosomal peptide synthetase n=1 Tax=Paenibacillus sp. 598K TaxID=1117987 RepID=UPI000FFE6A42
GAAYVPIDPAYPAERVRYVLEDSGVGVVLTQTKLTGALSRPEVDYSGALLLLDDSELSMRGNMAGQAWAVGPAGSALPSSLAYVIYTSGSTGAPKGVLIEQRSVVNLVRHSWLHLYEGRSELRIGMVASHIFDASVQQLFVALLTGSTLYVLTEEVKGNPALWVDYLVDHRIQAIDGTPSYLHVMLQAGGPRSRELRLETMLIGGEALTPAVIASIREASGGADFRIINTYGPTETCVDAAYYPVEESNRAVWSELPTIPIGYPSDGARLYILTAQDQPTPIGVTGELCIAGAGVGRGYLNRPELTAERFVADPFVPGARMYRSGDLARWLPDGTIEYAGRLDDQIKLHGYRIELGEIESALRAHPDVADAAVIVRRSAGGDGQLAAYYTGAPQPGAALRDWLLGRLPAYMAPPHYVHLEQLPLAPSGKVNRQALPEPGALSAATAATPAMELSGAERRIARLWEEALGASGLGRDAHFFELGGHSLKALLLSGRLSRELGVEVPMHKLFEHPTLGAFADWLAAQPGAAARLDRPILAPAPLQLVYPATSAQQRMVVLNRLNAGDRSYNMPQAYLLRGELDRERLAAALSALVERYEILRTSFHLEGDEVRQRIATSMPLSLEELVLDSRAGDGELMTKADTASRRTEGEETVEDATAWIDGVAELIDGWVRPFDLERLPLLRCGLAQVEEREHLLLLDMHHIVADGVTMSVLLDELAALYQGEALEPVELQYKDYAVWQRQWLTSADYRAQERYWLDVMAGELPVLELPTDYERPEVQETEGSALTVCVDVQTAAGLKRIAAETGSTLYMVLLAAYKTLLYRYTGSRELIVGVPVSGRTLPEAASMPGLFVNTLALRTSAEGTASFAEYVCQVRGTVLEALRHQDYPFEELVDQLQLPRHTGRHPLFDTMFAMGDASFSGRQLSQSRELGDLTLTGYPLPLAAAQFDLAVTAEETEQGLLLELVYSRSLFRPSTVERLAEQLLELLRQAAEQPRQSLDLLELSPPHERERLLTAFQPPQTTLSEPMLLHERFEQQARRCPDRIAVTDGEVSLTYAELDRQADALAERLVRAGIVPESTVGLLANRSTSMVTGLLAIWKAGGAYVPVSPTYPADYMGAILADSGAAAVVVADPGLAGLPELAEPSFAGPVLVLDDGDESGLADRQQSVATDSDGQPSDPEQSIVGESGRRLAYVIYTSGTTGRPKGVEIEHRSAINLAEHLHRSVYGGADGLRIALTAAHVFDASLQQLLTALLSGGTLYVVPEAMHQQPSRLLEALADARIDSVDGTPSYLRVLLDAAGETRYPGLRWLLA